MRRLLTLAAAAAIAPAMFLAAPASASGCSYATYDTGPVTVYVDDDFPAGDPLGVWIYASADGSSNARDDSGCDAGGDGEYSHNWVF